MRPQILKYIKHLSLQDHKTLSQKALKTCEEVGELAKVVLPYDGAFATNHRFVAEERILEESVDTILCALSLAYDLGFDDDDIALMMERKTEKWASLQRKEEGITYPLPYEVHVTVSLTSTDDHINLFKETCATLGVKPIVLELTTPTTHLQDVMTSSKHYGNNRSAYEYAEQISSDLRNRGFVVVRTKIETVPWHPAAPQESEDTMPPGCYFESHVPVIVHRDKLQLLREYMIKRGGVHMSRNTFKRLDGGMVVQMLTLRSYEGVRSEFEDAVAVLSQELMSEGYDVGRIITEFAIFDTKLSHDAAWLQATS